MEQLDLRSDFLQAATWHGTLETAAGLLAAHPEIASGDIYTAAVLGDAAALQRFLALEPGNATAKGGPHGWDALTYLCFSKYLRLDRARSDGFVRAARALLDAGASANTGWYEMNHQPKPEWESALYGAAGVAHHAELTRLLLERGADPNDEEVPYHAPETHDNAALQVLVESGKLNADSLGMMLFRKTDWHDYEGIKWLPEFAAVGNGEGVRHLLDLGVPVAALYAGDGYFAIAQHSTALHVAAWRARPAVVKLLIERGAPVNVQDGKGQTPLALAVKACVDSYWTERRSPESVRALVDAGASANGVPYPSGYAEVDELLRAHGK